MTLHRTLAARIVLAAAMLIAAPSSDAFAQEQIEGLERQVREAAADDGNGDNDPAEEDDDEVKIEDNSFLIEEAFNQEFGIVQHIFNWIPSWKREAGLHQSAFDFVFTQEWPIFSHRHQFSYTLPMFYAAERSPTGELEDVQGFGDVMLNYRYQALDGEDGLPLFAPRFSVILRTADVDSGPKSDRPGYQVNLPISKHFERWGVHGNAGWTHVPMPYFAEPLEPLQHATATGYNLGGSVIRFVRPNFHLMLESLALWNEDVAADGREDDTFQLLLSPGFRWAPYTEGDTQWVVGMGVPVGLTRDAPDVSLFLYMSFEHRFMRERDE